MRVLVLSTVFLLFPLVGFAQDSDGDGLDDATEAVLGTNYLDVDSDNDGLGDGFESTVSMTNPLAADTDGGGDWDVVELVNGQNPTFSSDDTGTSSGNGSFAQFLDDNYRTYYFLSDAENALASIQYDEMRGFVLNHPINFSEFGDRGFPQDRPYSDVWGEVREEFAASFSGRIVIPPSSTPTTKTFALRCEPRCRFRVSDGTGTRSMETSNAVRRTLSVSFPASGGLFEFEIIHFQRSGTHRHLDWSWSDGAVEDLVLVPPTAILSPNVVVDYAILDSNGGNLVAGDPVVGVLRVTNPSPIAAYRVQLRARGSDLINRSFQTLPDGVSEFSGTVTIPIIDPGQTVEIRFNANVASAPSTLREIFGMLASVSQHTVGRNRVRKWSDSPDYADSSDIANSPVGFFGGSAGDDDPVILELGVPVSVDECQFFDPCDVNASCQDLQVSYSCTCNTGWVGDGLSCTDENECAVSNPCDPNALCTNEIGSFSCACNDGYAGDGQTCADIDECATGAANCSADAKCINEPGTFSCECNDGFTGDGVTCFDVNECMDPNICDPNATCTNLVGSHTCVCNGGFAGDGVVCSDVDECMEGLSNCSSNAICTNETGTFRCDCAPGFVGDGLACNDVNECTDGTDNCSENADCTNTSGSFSCRCRPGYAGDGVNCVPSACHCTLDETCANEICFANCQTSDECEEGEQCRKDICVVDACDSVSCADDQICREGACFQRCGDSSECTNPDHQCYAEFCATWPCDRITCGSDQTCHGGTCFKECQTDDECGDDQSCFDGRCAASACEGVACATGQLCYGGTCFDSCEENEDCDAGTLCYEGRCAGDPCLDIACPEAFVCYGGSCFEQCTGDVDCSNPEDMCFEFRCAVDVCEDVQCPNGQSCVQGFCRMECSPSNPCEAGLDCEQGLCVPTRTATGCGCATRNGIDPFALFILGLFFLPRVRRSKRFAGH